MPKAKAAAPKKSSVKPKKSPAKKSPVAKVTAKAAPKVAAKAVSKAASQASMKAVSKTGAGAASKKIGAKPDLKAAAPKAAAKATGKSAVLKGVLATVATVAAATVVAKVAKSVAAASKTSVKKPTLKKAPPAAPVKAHHMPAAPSSRMTLLKLGFSTKEQAAILAAPHGFKIPDNADEPATLDAQYDFILIFVENITEAEVICASLNPCLRPKGRAWVAWPKGGASDVNLDQLSGMVEAEGLQKVAHLSLDERWSAAKFMHPKAER